MLNYYRVDESLWQDQQQLIRLSRYSLDAALKEKKSLGRKYRLRDLPNITYHLESLLNEAGIKDVSTLRILGQNVLVKVKADESAHYRENTLFAGRRGAGYS